MSRAEKRPIHVAENVTLKVDGVMVSASGPKGAMSVSFNSDVSIRREGAQLYFQASNGTRQARAMVGTARALVANMIVGVTVGFSKQLEISGVGFKALQKGVGVLELSLGTSHPILYALPDDVKVTLGDGGVRLTVEGADRQKVGQVAADIFSFYPMEPYKGKGVRIVGKFVRRKEGKKAA